MADQLSGIAIIICIAFGVLTFILLFLFAQRQILRFALKSKHVPHVPIGVGATRCLLSEIERWLNAVRKILCEPPVLNEENEQLFSDPNNCTKLSPTHLYRMKVVQDVKNLEILIMVRLRVRPRRPVEDVRTYYMTLHKYEVLANVSLLTLNKFLSLYEYARYEPQEFSYEDYKCFAELLESVKNSIFSGGAGANNPVDNFVTSDDCGKQSDNEHTSLLLKKTVSFDASVKGRRQSPSSVETEV